MTARRLAAALIRALRPVRAALFPPACRFAPSCSRFAEEAFLVHGVLRAAPMIALRLLRCHPFDRGGYHPVPHPHHG